MASCDVQECRPSTLQRLTAHTTSRPLAVARQIVRSPPIAPVLARLVHTIGAPRVLLVEFEHAHAASQYSTTVPVVGGASEERNNLVFVKLGGDQRLRSGRGFLLVSDK